MKINPFRMLLLVGVLMTGMTAGCAGTSAIGTFADVQDAYIGTVDVLLEARATGSISEEEWQATVLPAIILGDAALDEWKAAILAGEDATAHDAARTVLAVLQNLSPYIE